MKALVKYQLIVFFGAMLVLPMLNSAFKFVSFERPDENRIYRDSLAFDINQLDKFPEECEEYFNDNFSFRTPLLNAYHHLKFNYFNVSPHPDKTILGSNDWYFLAGDELEDYEGRRQLTEDQLKKIKEEWLKRKAFFDARGIKYYWLIAPAKHEVYGDQLPFYAVKSKQKSRTDQVISYLNTDFPNFIIDPRKALIEAKAERNVFYRLDNHWTHYGALTAVNELFDRIQSDFPQHYVEMPHKVEWKTESVQWGIHYDNLGIRGLKSTEDFPEFHEEMGKRVGKYGFHQAHDYSYEWEFEERYQYKGCKSKLRILLIRDSFGDNMVPFIKESFNESVFIFDYWEYKLNPEIIDVVKPDIVVYENISKFLQVYAGDDKYD